MTPLEWTLAALLWAVGCTLVVALRMLRAVEAPAPTVRPLTRQESTDQLPISLALFGSWTRPANSDTPEQLEAVKAAVRELHPDLATALDRAVEASSESARAAARERAEAPPVPEPMAARYAGGLAACKRGQHAWRGVVGMDVEQCDTPGCREIRTVA